MNMQIPDINKVILDYPEFTGVHPIANAFPMKPEDEFWELVEHIKKIGVAEKLLREKETGLLIDGRNRLLAVSFTQSLFEVEDVDSEFVLGYVTAKNLHAKKFDASQRAVIAARLRPFYDAQAKERQIRKPADSVQEKVPEQNNQQARDAAGKVANVNGKYVDHATKIERASPAIAQAVLDGKMTLKEGLTHVAPIIAAAKDPRQANCANAREGGDRDSGR